MKHRLFVYAVAVIASLALALGLGACGGDPDPTATPAPTATTPPTATPSPTDTPVPTATTPPTAMATEQPAPTDPPAMSEQDKALAEYAAEYAGGPGAIFMGDPMHLIGLPPHQGLMFDLPEAMYTQLSMLSLMGEPSLGLPSQSYIYTSDYYQQLIQKARLTDPTELTSSGESIEIQHVCITRNLPTCILIQTYWAPNLAKRTNGQVKLSVVGFAELGLAGPDTLEQVGNGTLDMVNIYTGYVAGAEPALEIQSLWGMSSDWETTYLVLTDLVPDVDQIILDSTGGSHVLNRNWFAGSDQWFFANSPLMSVDDFQGLKIRSHSASMSDFITGMGAEAIFLGPAELYPALERGVVDAAATAALLAVPDGLFEVSEYMSGPVIAFGYTNNVINKDVWSKIPPDLQQIIIEEGAKTELEALRLAPFQNVIAVQANQQLGIQPVPFSEEIVNHIRSTVLPEHVIPGWLQRLGFPGKNEDIVDVANQKISPYIGLWINEDGSLDQVPISKGPRSR